MSAPAEHRPALAEQLEKYRDALAFYADPESWKRRQGQWDMTTGPLPRVVGQESDIELDRGRRARLARPAIEEEV